MAKAPKTDTTPSLFGERLSCTRRLYRQAILAFYSPSSTNSKELILLVVTPKADFKAKSLSPT
jgi:hypothetical protein